MHFRLIILTIIVFILLFTLLFVVLENNSEDAFQSQINNVFTRQQAYILPVSNPIVPIRDWNVGSPLVDAKAAIIYDTQSNQILYDRNLNRKLPIASITKIISAIVVLENMDLDRIIGVPLEAVNVTGEGAGLLLNEHLTVDELMWLMLIESNNDAANTLALNSNFDFLGEINNLARRIGMNDSRFYDPAGFDDRGLSTVGDLVNLVKYSLKYDYLWEIMRTRNAVIVSEENIVHDIENTNILLDQLNGIIGGKTGYTDLALGNMLLVVKDNRPTIAIIVLGSSQRFNDTKILYNWAREAYLYR